MSRTNHPSLAIYVDDVDRPVTLVAHWLSNRHGELIATRERPIESEDALDGLLAQAGSIDGPAPGFLRAFVVYRQALEAAQRRLRTTPVWVDGYPYHLVETREAKGRLLVSESDWACAPGEAALFLAEWSPDGQCPVEATDLWSCGLGNSLWTQRRFDPDARLPRVVRRTFIRPGDPDHPFRPDMAVIASSDAAEGGATLVLRACGDDWADGEYAIRPDWHEVVYWIANHGGDVRREPIVGELNRLQAAPASLQRAVVGALSDEAPVEAAGP